MFERILVASDLTPTSEPALRAAVRLAREQRAPLIVLHVSERHHQAEHWLVPFFEEEMRVYGAAVKREMETARERLDAAARALSDGQPLTVEAVVQPGRAAETIVDEAKRRDADLIVVGTHGATGMLGSVAARVVGTARCPVLVVPG
jgi:nucleotide-binding universal stress UspA family protein